jgi:hypothetical protein
MLCATNSCEKSASPRYFAVFLHMYGDLGFPSEHGVIRKWLSKAIPEELFDVEQGWSPKGWLRVDLTKDVEQ